jgi:hypothetical protein
MTKRNKPLRVWYDNPRDYEFTSNAVTAGELRLKRIQAKAKAARDRLNALLTTLRDAIRDDYYHNAALEELYLEHLLAARDRREYEKRKRELDRVTRLLEHDTNQRLLARVRNTRRAQRWPR